MTFGPITHGGPLITQPSSKKCPNKENFNQARTTWVVAVRSGWSFMRSSAERGYSRRTYGPRWRRLGGECRRLPAQSFEGDSGVHGAEPCLRACPLERRAAARFISVVVLKNGVVLAMASTQGGGDGEQARRPISTT